LLILDFVLELIGKSLAVAVQHPPNVATPPIRFSIRPAKDIILGSVATFTLPTRSIRAQAIGSELNALMAMTQLEVCSTC
jgi:hypothetical protein